MFDVMLGTVDRKGRDQDWLTPERHSWLNCGADWIRRFTSKGAKDIPKHPSYSIDEEVD